MKTFGHINFQENEIQQAGIGVETVFPEFPKVGRLLFKDKVLYICAEIQEGMPVWIPLTNEIGTYIHYQNMENTTWVVTHNLYTTSPVVQVYQPDNRMVLPDSIEVISNRALRITFGRAVTGRAVILTGPDTGLVKENAGYEHTQADLSDVWTINHGLGFYPMVRVFIGNYEVMPASIEHPDMFTTIVRFTEPQAGIARLV
jgi:hypothetical protein